MMGGLFAGVIVAAVLGFFAWAIASARKPAKVDPDTGATVLHYSWVLRGLGLVAAFFMPLLIAVLLFVIPIRNPTDPLIAAGLAGFFILLGFPLLLETMCVRVDVSEESIRKTSPWHRRRELFWDEIEEVKYSQALSAFVFIGPRRRKIRVPLLIAGVRELAEAVRRHLDRDRYADAERGFDMLDRWGLGGRR
jgi:hypothetical protein